MLLNTETDDKDKWCVNDQYPILVKLKVKNYKLYKTYCMCKKTDHALESNWRLQNYIESVTCHFNQVL